MTAQFASRSFASVRLLRVSAALAVATGSILVLRQIGQGSCLWDGPPTSTRTHYFGFMLLTLVFSLAFIWLAAEIARPVLAKLVNSKALGRIAAVLAGFMIYLSIAGVVWGMHPALAYGSSGTTERGWLSGFWVVGLLVETGNFGDYPCGY